MMQREQQINDRTWSLTGFGEIQHTTLGDTITR